MKPTPARLLFPAILVVAASLFFLTTSRPHPLPPPVYKQEEVLALMKRVLEYQVTTYKDATRTGWQVGVFWTGVMAAYDATGDEAFHTAAKAWGERVQWKISGRVFYADALAAAQAYLELYFKDRDPKIIADLTPKFAQYLTAKTVDGRHFNHPAPASDMPFEGRTVWWWADALFMAPPALARMYVVTGDWNYLKILNRLYWSSAERLYDKQESLFFRDASYFPNKKLSPEGKKIFWSRGNGWVYAGLIRTIDYLPDDYMKRRHYILLFQKMSEAVLRHQGKDGLWRSSLTEPSWFPNPESTGSGLFVYGLLAGINRGYLDRETYLPAALRGWRGLAGLVSPEGAVGYAQKIGEAPAAVAPEKSTDYGQGIFLMAASELTLLNPGPEDFER